MTGKTNNRFLAPRLVAGSLTRVGAQFSDDVRRLVHDSGGVSDHVRPPSVRQGAAPVRLPECLPGGVRQSEPVGPRLTRAPSRIARQTRLRARPAAGDPYIHSDTAQAQASRRLNIRSTSSCGVHGRARLYIVSLSLSPSASVCWLGRGCSGGGITRWALCAAGGG